MEIKVLKEIGVTNDDVIEIVKKSNLIFRYDYFEIASENSDGIMIDDLTNFANLVAAKERDACAKLCKESDRYRGDYFASIIKGKQ